MRRSLTLRYITDPATGRRYPIPAGGAGEGGSSDGDAGDGADGGDDSGDSDAGDAAAAAAAAADGDDDADPDGADALGDPGKQALDRMKGERNAARDELRPWKALADELDLTPGDIRNLVAAGASDEKRTRLAVDSLRNEAREEALRTVGQIAVRANVKAQATGRLADPADALAFIDLSQFEVTDAGDVDEQAIRTAIDDLLKKKPHLAAQGGQKWQGGSDGGARNDPPKPEPKPGLDRLRHAYQSN